MRRGKGEGSVTRRPNGRWMGQADVGWKDGKRLRKTVYGRTKREVQDKLREIVQRMGRGEAPIPERETVASFLQRWLQGKKSEVRPRTHENYEQIVRNHLTPGLGANSLGQARPERRRSLVAASGKPWGERPDAPVRTLGATVGAHSSASVGTRFAQRRGTDNAAAVSPAGDPATVA